MFVLKSKYKALEIEKIILSKELEEAKSLKGLLTEIVKRTGIPPIDTKTGSGYLYGTDFGLGYSSGAWHNQINLGDDVLQYTDDILGGKVIKQEGNKCLVIAKDGTVKTGLTKAKVDKGYSYKLVRE